MCRYIARMITVTMSDMSCAVIDQCRGKASPGAARLFTLITSSSLVSAAYTCVRFPWHRHLLSPQLSDMSVCGILKGISTQQVCRDCTWLSECARQAMRCQTRPLLWHIVLLRLL